MMQEAVEKHYSAGSTTSVVLLLNDEELLVANVGDSKVILCAGKITLRGCLNIIKRLTYVFYGKVMQLRS